VLRHFSGAALFLGKLLSPSSPGPACGRRPVTLWYPLSSPSAARHGREFPSPLGIALVITCRPAPGPRSGPPGTAPCRRVSAVMANINPCTCITYRFGRSGGGKGHSRTLSPVRPGRSSAGRGWLPCVISSSSDGPAAGVWHERSPSRDIRGEGFWAGSRAAPKKSANIGNFPTGIRSLTLVLYCSKARQEVLE